MSFFSVRTLFCAATLIFALFSISTGAFAEDAVVWRPVTPAELEMKVPLVDAGADAEAIFWDIMLDDKASSKLTYRHYVRVKIFTEFGREKFAKMDIPFGKGMKVENVAARVIKPDGTVVVLRQSDIFEREIVRLNKLKVQAITFAVPGIEQGVIVEYQYSESFKGDSANAERLLFQRDIPMQKVTYHIRPAKYGNLQIRSFNMPNLLFRDDPDNEGFQVASESNVPALSEEPHMPPEDEVRRWAYLSYSRDGWPTLAYGYGQFLAEYAKPGKEVKLKAAELTNGLGTANEKLARIYEFVQTNIRNITFDRALTDKQREDLKIKNTSDVLQKRVGSTMHIDLLFAALADSAGFETAVYLTGDRTGNFFTPEKYPFPGFVHPGGIAVRVDSQWQFFNPGTPYLSCGRVVWYEEGMPAMLINSRSNYAWSDIPMSDPAKSPAKRTAKLRLTEDGALEGQVTVEYDGHQASRRRGEGFMASPAKREETVIAEAKSNMSNAEITAVSIENFENGSKPLVYTYNVKVPAYAQRTGKRLFFQPGYFEYGVSLPFSTEKRTHPIYFPYPWSEHDDIEIQLPKGFSLESGESSGEVFDPPKTGRLKVDFRMDSKTGLLKYTRDFYFGTKGQILFPPAFYLQIKNLFAGFHKSDSRMITLKQD